MIELSKIKQKIEAALEGSEVEVSDFSQEHVAHNPTGDHIEINIKYDGWNDKPLIAKHRIIYDILKEEMVEAIHALKINIK
jgi:stress-induced morphogen